MGVIGAELVCVKVTRTKKVFILRHQVGLGNGGFSTFVKLNSTDAPSVRCIYSDDKCNFTQTQQMV